MPLSGNDYGGVDTQNGEMDIMEKEFCLFCF
jgi:hypothetical protein